MAKQLDNGIIYLSVVDLIKKGRNQAQISKILNRHITQINKVFTRLRKEGRITKKGYGVWQFQETKQLDNERGGLLPIRGGYPVPDMSLHDLVFKVRIPLHLAGWRLRGHYLDRLFPGKSESWRQGDGSEAQKLDFGGYTILFYDRYLILHVPRAFFSHNHLEASRMAEVFAKDLLRALWRKLRLYNSFSRNFQVEWTDRQHYAKVNDSVARDFRRCNRKVRVPLKKGFFVIDFSDHMDHVEVQHGGGDFLDQCWKPWLLSLEQNPGYTISLQLELNQGMLVFDAETALRLKKLEERVFRD